MAYDQKKAEAYNKLIQQGLSEDAAATQAGIDPNDYSYSIGNNGQLGPLVVGSGARNNEVIVSGQLPQSTYPQTAAKQVSTVTEPTVQTNSTEAVSGGGTTTIISGQPKAGPTTAAAQANAAASQAELDQFIKDNPSNFARKRQGLPPLTAEENEAREAKRRELEDKVSNSNNQVIDSKIPGAPTIIETPNTTTTTNTVVAQSSVENTPVPYTSDPNLENNQEEVFDNTSGNVENNSPTPVTQDLANERNDAARVDALAALQVDGTQDLANERNDAANVDALAALQVERNDAANVDATQDLANERNDAANVDALAALQVERNDAANVDATQDLANERNDAANVDALAALQGERNDAAAVDATQDLANERNDAANVDALAALQGERNDAAAVDAAYKNNAQNQNTLMSRVATPSASDWRVRLSLAQGSTYLYNAGKDAGILQYLQPTNGVVFPYTPSIETNYTAKYDPYDLVHSNYRGYFYRGSSVGEIQVKGTFTAQDTNEANYLLAVIHFFRSVTKMFYGQDSQAGTPPPLVYLSGFGQYQFNNHSCVVSSFNYSLPTDVDYIRAGSVNNMGVNLENRRPLSSGPGLSGSLATVDRLFNNFLSNAVFGKKAPQSNVSQNVNNTSPTNATYVPTKMEISITLLPIQTRSQVSKQFSLKGFANGDLLKKGFW